MTDLQIADLDQDVVLDHQALVTISGGFNAAGLDVVGGNSNGVLDLNGAGVSLFSPTIVVQNVFSINPVTQVAQIFDQDLTTNITNILNSVLA